MSKTDTLTIRLYPGVKKQLADKAASTGISTARMVLIGIRLYLQRCKRLDNLPSHVQAKFTDPSLWTPDDWTRCGIAQSVVEYDDTGTKSAEALDNLRNYYAYCVDLQQPQPTKE